MSTRVFSKVISNRKSLSISTLRKYAKSSRNHTNGNNLKKKPIKCEFQDYSPTKLKLEFNKVATLVDGSVIASCGNTSVIVTAAVSNHETSNIMVDYLLRPVAHNRLMTHPYAATYLTRLPVLCGRAVDRSVRVCIPSSAGNQIKVDCVVLSNDLASGDHLLLAINGIHAILCMIDVPYIGPMAAVRVGCTKEGEFIFNPTAQQLRDGILNLLLVVDCHQNIVMLETEANNIPVSMMSEALDFGVMHGTRLADNFKSIAQNTFQTHSHEKEQLIDFYRAQSGPEVLKIEKEIKKMLSDSSHTKNTRDEAFRNLLDTVSSSKVFSQIKTTDVEPLLNGLRKEILNDMAVTQNKRADGRKLHELRPINSEIDYTSFAHGSARFQRGETQVLASVTFDGESSRKNTKGILYSVGIEDRSNFMLDYYFHSFCTSQGHLEDKKGPIGSTRREMGHGSIGEKALRPLIPDDFPFKIKITSDVVDSSGSTSMATICAGSLALMDAGVNISEPAAGVAIGLFTNDTTDPSQFVIANDIQGFEDHSGYMDFKIGGTKNGLTAAQFDTKIPGLPLRIIKQCFLFGQASIQEIIKRMTSSANITSPKEHMKENAPVLKVLKISEHEAVRFIGRMASHRRNLETEYGIQINLEEDGLHVYAPNEDILKAAEAEMEKYYQPGAPELVQNNIYEAQIVGKSEKQFTLRIHPNMDDVTLNVSQITSKPIQSTALSGYDIGDKIHVKYFGRDPVSGKLRFSRSAMLVSGEKIVRQRKRRTGVLKSDDV